MRPWHIMFCCVSFPQKVEVVWLLFKQEELIGCLHPDLDRLWVTPSEVKVLVWKMGGGTC